MNDSQPHTQHMDHTQRMGGIRVQMWCCNIDCFDTRDVVGVLVLTLNGCHGIPGHGILLLLGPTFGILGDPLHQGVMDQGLQHTQQGVPVGPQYL